MQSPSSAPQKLDIAILGAGESGTGAALLAHAKGLSVFVSDAGTIAPKYKAQLQAASIAFEEGQHTEATILSAREIIKSPGIAPNTDLIRAAFRSRIPVMDELEFAGRYAKGKRICITGSNGKTTTTLLIYHILKAAGYSVGLAGNIGTSMAAQLVTTDHDFWVLEVSSFQLDGMPTFQKDVAIILNITPDHLDRYNHDFDQYIASKAQMFDNLSEEGLAIGMADSGPVQDLLDALDESDEDTYVLCFGTTGFLLDARMEGEELIARCQDATLHIPASSISIKGAHNHLNAMAASLAALYYGVPVPTLAAALGTFANAPHRLEEVGYLNFVRFINDSKATNLDSVRYAFSAVPEPTIWIAGGKDKGNDYATVLPHVQANVKALICLTKYPEPLLATFEGVVPTHVVATMAEAVHLAFSLALPGYAVLLSPACASFDLFKNYEDRGDQFRAEVLQLIAAHGSIATAQTQANTQAKTNA